MVDFAINLSKSKIPDTYYYHNYEHTRYVINKAVEIGKLGGLADAELRLLSADALWHDVAYINTYQNHKEESCKVTSNYLPGYSFNDAEVKTICPIIMTPKIPYSPANNIEEVLADANMEYLGTKQAAILYRKLKALYPLLTKDEWHQIEIRFSQEPRFFTDYYKRYSVAAKIKYLNSLIYRS